jgi:DNA primase catalytic core, N-terminal domain
VHRSTATRFGVGYYGGSGFLRQRIVFPIHDSQGRLVAYAGRSIDDSEPRYLFPPGFRKSQVVFNLQRAMLEAAQCAIVVEGFFDCLRVQQAGCTRRDRNGERSATRPTVKRGSSTGSADGERCSTSSMR